MKKILLIFLLANLSTLAVAAFEEIQTDARIYGLAGAGVAITDLSGTDICNPALPALADDLTVSSGSCLPFAVRDLAAFSGTYARRKSKIGTGIRLSTFGGSSYRENQLGGSLAYRITENAALGLSLNGFHLGIDRYGSAAAVGLDIGILSKPAEWVSLGLAAVNLNRPAIGSCREELSQSLSFGTALRPLEQITVSAELYCQRDWPCQVRIGQEYRCRNLLSIRTGFSDRPNTISLGFGVAVGDLRLDYAARTHPDLGLSHCISVGYVFQRIFAEHCEIKQAQNPRPKIIGKIDPNMASSEELCLLPGIGPRAADDILACRDSIGGFKYLDDLGTIRGIGKSTLEKIAPFVSLQFKPQSALMVNINTADPGELESLPGIGPKTAADIIAYRNENGPFRNSEDLMNVKGIGRKTYEGIKSFITIGQ